MLVLRVMIHNLWRFYNVLSRNSKSELRDLFFDNFNVGSRENIYRIFITLFPLRYFSNSLSRVDAEMNPVPLKRAKFLNSFKFLGSLWVILSPQVKSLEREMQGPVDGRISPNCKRGYMDPRTASVQILNRDQRTADWVLIFKGESRDPRTATTGYRSETRSEFSKKDPRTAESVWIFKRDVGFHGPPNRSEFLKET